MIPRIETSLRRNSFHPMNTPTTNSSNSFDYESEEGPVTSDIAAIIFTACMLFLAAAVMASCYCVYRNGEPLRILYYCLPCAAPDHRYRRKDRVQEDETMMGVHLNDANNQYKAVDGAGRSNNINHSNITTTVTTTDTNNSSNDPYQNQNRQRLDIAINEINNSRNGSIKLSSSNGNSKNNSKNNSKSNSSNNLAVSPANSTKFKSNSPNNSNPDFSTVLNQDNISSSNNSNNSSNHNITNGNNNASMSRQTRVHPVVPPLTQSLSHGAMLGANSHRGNSFGNFTNNISSSNIANNSSGNTGRNVNNSTNMHSSSGSAIDVLSMVVLNTPGGTIVTQPSENLHSQAFE